MTKQNLATYTSLFPSSGLIKLPYKILVVQGVDAEKFLQGQLSCDLAEIQEGTAGLGTANTPKGRIYGLFKIIRDGERFLLRIHNSMAESIVTRLSKYKVFFKCTLEVDERYTVYGVIKPDWISADIEYPEGEYLLSDNAPMISIDSAQQLFELWTTKEPKLAVLGDHSAEEWACMESINGIPEIYPETSEAFILQYLNLHELKAVSFKKGCYTGQEIIARMKFLGKLKKKTYLLHSQEKTSALPGDFLYDINGKKSGEIVRTHYTAATGTITLAVLPIIDHEENRSGILVNDNRDAFYIVNPLNY